MANGDVDVASAGAPTPPPASFFAVAFFEATFFAVAFFDTAFFETAFFEAVFFEADVVDVAVFDGRVVPPLAGVAVVTVAWRAAVFFAADFLDTPTLGVATFLASAGCLVAGSFLASAGFVASAELLPSPAFFGSVDFLVADFLAATFFSLAPRRAVTGLAGRASSPSITLTRAQSTDRRTGANSTISISTVSPMLMTSRARDGGGVPIRRNGT